MVEEEVSIQNFEDLIKDHVGATKIIEDITFTNLTAPGENYMSDMKKMSIKLKDKTTGQIGLLHAVAKCFPQSNLPNEKLNKMVDELNKANFYNELLFYKEILPCLKEFQEKCNVEIQDLYPKVIGARYNLSGSPTDTVDKDAVLILDDLIEQGYANADRHEGFNLEEAKVILKHLAYFHAVPVALKIKEPQTFQKLKDKIKKSFPPSGDSEKPKPPEEVLCDILKGDPSIEKVLQRFKVVVAELRNKGETLSRPSKEPFATLVHNDMWLNNTMQKYEGENLKNKFIDFQTYSVNSPIKDLIFLIFTSFKSSVKALHVNRLIKYYHKCFIDILTLFKCDISQFNYDKFMEELKEEAYRELTHILFLSIIIFGKKGTKAMEFGKHPNKDSITNLALDKCKETLKIFDELGWI